MKTPGLFNKGVGRAAISLAAVLLFAPVLLAAVAVGSSRALNRLVTPGLVDGHNDTFVFQCHNPSELLVKGEIFDLRGRKVADMTLHSISLTDSYYNMEWDPNSGMRAPGGVYIYQIRFGETLLKGTVVVIR